MELTLIREPSQDGATIGRLFIDGALECYTCEDVVRPAGEKMPGQTAIPAGRYRVVLSWSPRFQRILPLLQDVPGFSGIRIHPGNSADDTEGCLLVGVTRTATTVGQSRMAFGQLYRRLAVVDGEIWLTVADP